MLLLVFCLYFGPPGSSEVLGIGSKVWKFQDFACAETPNNVVKGELLPSTGWGQKLRPAIQIFGSIGAETDPTRRVGPIKREK